MKTYWKYAAAILIAAVLFVAVTIALRHSRADDMAIGPVNVIFPMSSASFANGGDIPKQFTCDGADISPQLSWSKTPRGTKTFALIADDPDAAVGTWTHWVLYDLPADTTSLPEGMTKTDTLPGGGKQGLSDFEKVGYGGPCPPGGSPHRYFFKLFALDRAVDLKPGAQRQDLEDAMKDHVLGGAQWMGKYHR